MISLNQFAQYALWPLSDKWFSVLQYFKNQKRLLNLKRPKTFNEKIQWLKIYYRNPLLRTCVDKYTVREFVSQKIGNEYLVPLINVYSTAEEINFCELPNQFVLKATHGSGWNIICRDASSLDKFETYRKLNQWLHCNFYWVGREWPYDKLTPRIICEKLLLNSHGESPWDYKIFCFHGQPHYIQVDYGRFTNHSRAFYDLEWKRIPCKLEYSYAPVDTAAPLKLREMLEIAKILSQSFPFVRVDLYEVENRIYFGELTFYPGKGVERFEPRNYDNIFGQWLVLEEVKKEIEANYVKS